MRSIKEINQDIADILPKRYKGNDQENAAIEDKFRALCVELETARAAEGEESQALEQKASGAAKKALEGVYLPHCPSDCYVVPNFILRSALFGVAKAGKTSVLKQEISSQSDTKIIYSGFKLEQGDLDILLIIMDLYKGMKLGDILEITAYGLLTLQGKTDCKTNKLSLDNRLIRLKATALEVHQGESSIVESIISTFYREAGTRKYSLCLDSNFANLFLNDEYTIINKNIRNALAGKPLAQWLYGYFASHGKAYPVKIETLFKLSGSDSKKIKNFRTKLLEALKAVESTCKKYGVVFNYKEENGLIRTYKEPTRTQSKHLSK